MEWDGPDQEISENVEIGDDAVEIGDNVEISEIGDEAVKIGDNVEIHNLENM